MTVPKLITLMCLPVFKAVSGNVKSGALSPTLMWFVISKQSSSRMLEIKLIIGSVQPKVKADGQILFNTHASHLGFLATHIRLP